MDSTSKKPSSKRNGNKKKNNHAPKTEAARPSLLDRLTSPGRHILPTLVPSDTRRPKKDNGTVIVPSWGTKNDEDDGSGEYAGRDWSRTDFETGDDFIAFEPASDGERSSPLREWDQGNRSMLRRGNDISGAGPSSSKRKRHGSDYNESDGYTNKKQRVAAASRRAPWAVNVDWGKCNNVAEMLHREVDAFIQYISPTDVEHEIRALAIQCITNAIRRAFPDATVHPFGSFETRLYLPLGDIDLVIQSDTMACSDVVTVLRNIANIVRRAGITDRVTIIAKAKVPIVKFVTTHGRFAVDISINRSNGIAAGKMVNQFLTEIPALRGLILVTKSFLNQRSMNEVFSGGLGSYTIVCLAISFLQMHPKIRRGEIDPSKNLGVLVLEFFELYGRYFNYERTGISIRRGGSYFSKARRGWLDFRKSFLLSIEDPGDISNDISRGSFAIKNVKQTFSGAYEIMSSAAYIRAGIISARRSKRYVNLSKGDEELNPDEMSILSSVMGVTQETINQRRLIQEVYDKGTLHHLAGVPKKAANGTSQSKNKARNTESRRSPPSQRAAEVQSVKNAWGEADMDVSSVEDGKPDLRSRGSERGESESRYDITSRRTRKRQRAATPPRRGGDAVFTTDEDEDEDDFDDDYLQDEGESLYDEDEQRNVIVRKSELAALAKGDSNEQASNVDVRSKRRAYWDSKASAGSAGRVDDDSS